MHYKNCRFYEILSSNYEECSVISPESDFCREYESAHGALGDLTIADTYASKKLFFEPDQKNYPLTVPHESGITPSYSLEIKPVPSKVSYP